MQYPQLKELIKTRRSIRKYTDQSVRIEDIRELIEAARYAPSDTNSQTWDFIAILNRDLIRQIEQMTWTSSTLKRKSLSKTVSEKKPSYSCVHLVPTPPLSQMRRR